MSAVPSDLAFTIPFLFTVATLELPDFQVYFAFLGLFLTDSFIVFPDPKESFVLDNLGFLTVTLQVSFVVLEWFLMDTVIFAVPLFNPFTSPFFDTEAIFFLADL